MKAFMYLDMRYEVITTLWIPDVHVMFEVNNMTQRLRVGGDFVNEPEWLKSEHYKVEIEVTVDMANNYKEYDELMEKRRSREPGLVEEFEKLGIDDIVMNKNDTEARMYELDGIICDHLDMLWRNHDSEFSTANPYC